MIKKLLQKNIGVRTAVAAIITKGDKVMLTRRAKMLPFGGRWCLPGGSLDFGESVENAVDRELKEEIGLEVVSKKFLFYQNEHFPKIKFYAVDLVFSVKTKGKIKTNFEVIDVKWFTKEEIKKMKLAYSHNEILRRYFKEK